MKILFIVPTPGYGIKEKGQKTNKRISGFFPPLGAAFLATVLENAGHKCKVLDLQVVQFSPEELTAEVKAFSPDVACISVLTALYPEAMKIAQIIKKFTDIPIICGGQHVSLFPKETLLQNKEVDYVVFGEGEYKLLELITAIEKGTSKHKVKGIYFREGKDRVIETERAPEIENLDKLPIPSRKFFDMKKYIPVPNQYKRLPVTNMITSMGCTYALCKYCSESGILHQKYRRNSVDRTMEEIRYLVKEYKIREIYFWDDEFVMGGKWVDEFCEKLKKEKFDLTWSCYAKVNYVNQDMLNKMASAGCWKIFYGLESGNQELLNNIRKGQTLQQIRNAVKWTQNAGIEVTASFMLGLPGETPEMARKTIDFAIDLNLDYAIFCLTTPYPGTKLYEDFIKEGRCESKLGWGKYTCNVPIYLPEGYKNRKQLEALHKEAYRRFYIRPGYFIRKLSRINSAEDIMRYMRGIKFLLKMKLLNSPGM